MADNPFDQFDEPEGNPFDQFDAPEADPNATYALQATSGLNEGLANTLGLPVDLSAMAVNAGVRGANKAFGTNLPTVDNPALGSQSIKEALARASMLQPKAGGKGMQFARRTAQGVGEVAPFGLGTASSGASLMRSFASGVGSGVGGATAQMLAPDDPTIEALGSLIGGLTPMAAEAVFTRMNAAAQARKAVPTSEQLREGAGDLYRRAEQNGFTATQQQTQGLSDKMRQVATKEGLITPTGRIDASMPKVRSIIKMVDDFAEGDMSPSQMLSVRRTLQNAAGSTDPGEARVGVIMLKEFDDFTSKFAPEFKDARGLWARAMRAETLEKARELAGARAGQFTGSGFENALRTEYRKLDRDIINGKLKGFSKEEIKAIRRVARGTPASNAARNAGRMAPTGPVSFTGSVGVPTYLASQAMGPGAGLATGAGMAGLGYGGRALATRMGIKAADTAELLTRAGGVPPSVVSSMSTAQKEALAAVLASQMGSSAASNSQERP